MVYKLIDVFLFFAFIIGYGKLFVALIGLYYYW